MCSWKLKETDRETFKRMIPSVHLLDNKNSKGDTLIQALFLLKDWFKQELLQELLSTSSSTSTKPVASGVSEADSQEPMKPPTLTTTASASGLPSNPRKIPKRPLVIHAHDSNEGKKSNPNVNMTGRPSNLKQPKDASFQAFKQEIFEKSYLKD